MLAVFGKQRPAVSSPLSPGSKRRATEQTPEDEDFVASVLDGLYSSLPRRQRGFVQEMGFGGPSGIGYVESMRHQLSHDCEGIYVFFKGELQNNPSDLEDAEYILQEYKRTYEHASLLEPHPVMEMLGKLEGPFAFIVYDKSFGRIVAARDSQGLEPLVWGTTMLSDGLLFASDRALIEGECVDVDDFPAGTLFTSNDFSTAGDLTPIKPEGLEVPKELCRVESKTDTTQASSLQKVASQSQIEAN